MSILSKLYSSWYQQLMGAVLPPSQMVLYICTDLTKILWQCLAVKLYCNPEGFGEAHCAMEFADVVPNTTVRLLLVLCHFGTFPVLCHFAQFAAQINFSAPMLRPHKSVLTNAFQKLHQFKAIKQIFAKFLQIQETSQECKTALTIQLLTFIWFSDQMSEGSQVSKCQVFRARAPKNCSMDFV